MTKLSSKRASSIVAPFLLFCGLLLAVIIAVVIYFPPPDAKLPSEIILIRHQLGKNVIIGEKLIAPLLPLPPVRWSTEQKCQDVGLGVWYAEGRVLMRSPMGEAIWLDWHALFIPETSEPLFLAVGAIEQGNYNAALRRAGVDPGHP